jgi:hypothetical protein
MNEFITADDAVSKGHKWITIPVLIILAGGIFLSLYLVATEQISIKLFFIGFVSSMTVLPWLYWSLTINVWKNWAFENVRNVHELKRKAIEGNLIYDDESIFNKTIISFSWQKNKWNSLQVKFKQKDLIEKEIFVDDLTIDNETRIYYSKLKNYLEFIFGLLMLAVGIFILLIKKEYIWGSIISAIGVYFSITEFKEATNNDPQIILSNKGIQTSTTKFYPWKEIKNAKVKMERTSKNIYFYLVYDYPDGSEEVLLDDLKIKVEKLEELLKLYKGRSKR